MATVLILVLLSVMGAISGDGSGDGDEAVIIPGEYIVVLNMEAAPSTASETPQTVESVISELNSRYSIETIKPLFGAIRSLWIRGDNSKVQEAAVNMPAIQSVEKNKYINITQLHECVCYEERTSAGMWGLDRVDQRDKIRNTSQGAYFYNGPLYMPSADVDVYVVDTGIRIDHQLFGGRASWGYTATGITDGDIDGHGHGTHVAGTIGSTHYGVAKDVRLIAVKVFNNVGWGGSLATLIDGINWVFNDHMSKNADGNHKAIMNLSLGLRDTSIALEITVTHTIAAGVIAVAAAGNKNRDACAYTPAKMTRVITVGATDPEDKVAKFDIFTGSNWGTCLDVWAPGKDILSTSHESITATRLDSGTSMAAPHVTGAIAEYLKTLETLPSDPALAVNWWLALKGRSRDKVTFQNDNEATSPNWIIYSRCGGCVNTPGIIIMLGTMASCVLSTNSF